MRLPVRLEFVVALAAVAAVPIGLAFAGSDDGGDDPSRTQVANEQFDGGDSAGGAWDLDGDPAGGAEGGPETVPQAEQPAPADNPEGPDSTSAPQEPAPHVPDPDPQPTPDPTIPAVTYSYSGGVAGRTITVSIDANGHWTLTERNGRSGSGQLDAAQMAALGELLRSPSLDAEAGQEGGGGLPGGGTCADVPTIVVSTQSYEFRSGCNDPLPPTAAGIAELIWDYSDA